MGSSLKYFKKLLPLRESGFLEKSKDWVTLWENLALKGPALLYESAGERGDASQWIVLAGNPEEEFFEINGNKWLSTQAGIEPAPFSVFDFLDEVGKPGMGGELEKRFDKNYLKLGEIPPGAGFSPFPFSLAGAWFGIFSYEFGKRLTVNKKTEGNKSLNAVPDFYFFKPGVIVAFNRLNHEWFYFGDGRFLDLEKGDACAENFKVHSLEQKSSFSDYKKMVESAKKYILEGDIYQANLAQVFQAEWEGSPAILFRLLKELNPGPFMGIFRGRGFTVVSSSPERLVSCRGDWLETRPIAGTRPRATDQIHDLQNQWELKTNPKEQAEHLMLVDLARNDLGRISSFGTVEVKRFAQVESYSRVHHLVSIIQSRLSPAKKVSDVIRSLFPGGTITGCPKIRSMEIISELEAQPRGFYTGSMGYLGPGPCFDFNILIRSFTLFPNGTLEFLAGAGIVADSDPQKEYMETLFKVEALAQALGSTLFSTP